ncbi:MAG: hypothetical protein F2667_13040 [Actinobacteria bacterium]|uniref:Unannotated protein n=1 Tax=freshwater metagenome TaxID=449393 RepID=A0A6J6S496_9ZZZZ|nr:hypothetical protein [Actinomycetota bacterium]
MRASWSHSLPFAFDDARLVVGQPVQVVQGGTPLLTGVLADVQRGDPWTFEAVSLSQLADDFLALDSSGNPTTTISVAVAEAINRGLGWSNGSVFPAVTFGDGAAVQVNKLSALLTPFHDTTLTRWGVDAYGRAFSTTDPTTPRWVLDGSDVEIGLSRDELATVVVARYLGPGGLATVTRTNTAAKARYGTKELPLNLTNLGTISAVTATSYADQVLATAAQPTWLNQVSATPSKLTTVAGDPGDLSLVQAGQVVRIVGIPGRLGRLSGEGVMDGLIGEVSYEDGAREVSLSPTRRARRTLRDVIEALENPPTTSVQTFLR